MRKIIIYPFILILICMSVFGYSPVDHNVSLSSTDTSTQSYGFVFLMNTSRSSVLEGVTLHPTSNPQYVTLMNNDGTFMANSTPRAGNEVSFIPPITLVAGTSYRLSAHSNGTLYTMAKRNDWGSFPIVREELSWTNSCFSGSAPIFNCDTSSGGSNDAFNIVTINVQSSPEGIDFFTKSPTNSSNILEGSVPMYFDIFTSNLMNCSLWVNNVTKDQRFNLTSGTYSMPYNSSMGVSGYNNITMNCTNETAGQFLQTKVFFQDTRNVTIQAINYTAGPTQAVLDNATIISDTIRLLVQTNDTNNWLVNVTLHDVDNSTIFWSAQDTNLSENNIFNVSVPLSVLIVTGTYNFTVTASDAHTQAEVDFDKKLKDKDIDFPGIIGKEFDDKVKTYSEDAFIKSMDMVKGKDRKKFDIKFKNNVRTFNIYVEGKRKVDYVDTKYGYIAHFIIDDEYWYDLENDAGAIVKNIVKINDKLYRIIMEKDPDVDRILFKSIGIINTVQATVTFDYEQFALTNCSNGYPTINFTLKNSSSGAVGTGSIEGVFNYYKDTEGIIFNKNYSFINESTSSEEVCIVSNSTTFLGDFQILYTVGGTTYSYFGNNINFSNQTKVIDLLFTDDTSSVLFTVQDTGGNNLEDVFITIEKFNVGTNTFTTSEVLRTDSLGTAVAQIKLISVYYKMTLTYLDVERLVDGPTVFFSTSKNYQIDISEDDFLTDIDKSLAIEGEVTFINSTKVFAFDYNDASLSISSACLRVTKWAAAGNTILNNCTTSLPAGGLRIQIDSNFKNSRYSGVGYVIYPNGNEVVIDNLDVDFLTEWTFYEEAEGKSGVFVTFLIVLTLFMLGLWNPSVAIILGSLGLILSASIGFYYMSWGMIVTLILMGGIAVWRMGRSQ